MVHFILWVDSRRLFKQKSGSLRLKRNYFQTNIISIDIPLVYFQHQKTKNTAMKVLDGDCSSRSWKSKITILDFICVQWILLLQFLSFSRWLFRVLFPSCQHQGFSKPTFAVLSLQLILAKCDWNLVSCPMKLFQWVPFHFRLIEKFQCYKEIFWGIRFNNIDFTPIHGECWWHE